MEVLGKRINRVMIVNPGTPEVYDEIRNLNFSEELTSRLIQSLMNEEYLKIAGTELMFRIYELMLILENNPEKVLEYLFDRINLLGSFDNLLVECLINKIIISGTGLGGKNINYVTDSNLTIDILSDIVNLAMEDNISEIAINSLSFYIFDQVIKNGLETNEFNSKKINLIFNKYNDALESMKSKCISEATDLYFNCKNKLHIELKLKETLKNISEEVNEISNIKLSSSKTLIRRLSEDPVVWTTFAGAIGSMVSGIAPTITASIAISALSKVGTTALKVKREYTKKLNNSPWSVIHYLR